MKNLNIVAFPPVVDKNDPKNDMTRRNWMAARLIPSLVYGLIILTVVPLLLVKGNALGWLAVLMGIGPLLAGLWLYVTIQLGSQHESPEQRDLDKTAAHSWLASSALVAAIVALGAWLVITLGDQGWAGYTLLKSGGLITYALFGLLPVICYIWMMQRLLTMKSLGITIVLGLVSLATPWLWIGFLVYGQYNPL